MAVILILILFKNGSDFNILLSTFKLALLVLFGVRYSFESLTQERRYKANLNVNKRILKSSPFLNTVYSASIC